jgi:hypothetical protein
MGDTPEIGVRSGGLRVRAALAVFAAVVALLVVLAGTARADFAIRKFTTSATSYVAGAHADVNTAFRFSDVQNSRGNLDPDGHARRLEIDLPGGLAGDPSNFPRCTREEFRFFRCPAASQVGLANLVLTDGNNPPAPIPVYNMEPSSREPALLGINVANLTRSFVRIRVNPDGSLTAVVDDLAFGAALIENDMTLWGVPADHNGSGAERVPFMANGTSCTNTPVTTMRVWTYEDGDKVYTAHSTNQIAEDCAGLEFAPTMSAVPTQRAAAAPTGLDVSIDVPQPEDPDGRVTAHVKSVQIALPEGMKVSPSSANGLAACSPAEFGYGTTSPITCPDESKIGRLSIESPLLQAPLTGTVYLAKQNDNPFNSLLALYLVARGEGVELKLAGRVDPDPVTGRLTTTFDDNPELPFSRLQLSMKSGDRAPLVNPQTCGTYESETRITSYGGQTVTATTPMTIDQDCVPVGFSPSFQAGSVSTTAGSTSTFSLTFARGDHDQELRDVTVDMPTGLTGKIASADLCPDAEAAVGACGPGSRIGTITSSAGAGPSPFYLPGRAYITGPYKGAPFGLSFVVPAVAGPFDLGTVVVRAAIFVDQNDASLRVVSDPLPRILQGIPLQIRSVNVAVDKPGFMINPTSCAVKEIIGRIGSQQGAGADVRSRFQAGDCGRLPVKPKMVLEVGTSGKTRRGQRTPLIATLTQTPGQTNLRSVTVNLPRTLNSRLDVVNRRRACTIEQFHADRCPMRVGTGTAVTPLLRDPLTGPAYFVYNPDRRLPDLVVRLRGQVSIDLVGKVDIPRDLTLRTSFDAVPDVPISKFRLALESGPRNGPIGVVRDLCGTEGSSGRAKLAFVGQNGRRLDLRQRLVIHGCSARGRAARKSASKKSAKKASKRSISKKG